MSIVFLNFNRLVETRTTVERLRTLLAERDDCEVIAVDNGSTDGTAAYLRDQQDFLTAVLCPDNTGIAAYNVGFERARGEILLVLDDDSHPHDNDCLDRLLAHFAQAPSTGIVACRIEDNGGERCWSWHLPKADRAGPSMAFIGCGFAIRRTLFAAIGGYPGAFFLYQNEIDVAIQTRLAGFSIHYDPRCRVVHRSEGQPRPSARRVFYSTRNSLWLIRRYYRFPQAAYLLGSRVLIGALRALQFRQWRAFGNGVREGLSMTQTPSPMPSSVRREFRGFWRQNSIVHQLLRRT